MKIIKSNPLKQFFHVFVVTLYLLILAWPGGTEKNQLPFSLNVPRNWQYQQAKSGADNVYLYIHPSNNFFVRVRSYAIRASYNFDKIKRIFEYRELDSNEFRYKEVIKTNRQDKFHNPTLVASYEAHLDGIKVRITAVIIKKDKVAYSAMVAIKEKMFTREQREFLRIIESFGVKN